MNKSIIGGITEYFMQCPLLKDGVFRVDALGDQGVEYTIGTEIFEPVVRRYINGDTLRQYRFNFASREFYSMDRIQNIENSTFYEQLADWVEQQNYNQNFPEMPAGCYPEEIEVVSPGYLFDAAGKNAQYQIQLRLMYKKEAVR